MKNIPLNAGNGGKEMQDFLNTFLPNFHRGDWKNSTNDAATLQMPDGKNLCFTTDSFVVDPIEFPGGNIGDLAFAGTVNDLVVMGARPLGISLSLIIEENFSEETLQKIIGTIQALSQEYNIPVVTGDTKVIEKGSLDGIVINTSGVGIAEKVFDAETHEGDTIIVSGGIGEHGVALLSKRFDFETDIVSDTKPLLHEINALQEYILLAKDPTRGGIASALNEIAEQNNVEMEIWDEKIPMQQAVKTAGNLLGIDVLSLANEGKILCLVREEYVEKVLQELRTFNPLAEAIGSVTKKNTSGRVILKTDIGSRILSVPSGKIVPRIC